MDAGRKSGTTINSKALDYCPYITPDKKYFFFTSNRHGIKIPFDKKQNIKSLESILHSPLNGYRIFIGYRLPQYLSEFREQDFKTSYFYVEIII